MIEQMEVPFLHDSTVASQPCSSGHITADKREIKDFPKLPSATSFIRKTLGKTVALSKSNPLKEVR